MTQRSGSVTLEELVDSGLLDWDQAKRYMAELLSYGSSHRALVPRAGVVA